MKKKKRKLRWDNIRHDLLVLAFIVTLIAVVIASCQHSQAAAEVEEESTETAATIELECFKYVEGIPLPNELQTYINEVCKRYEIPPEIVFSIIEKESDCDYLTVGDNGDSEGLMQVQRQYHEERMQRLCSMDLLNPYQNVLVGVDYLAELLTYYDGNLEKALTAYNAGPTGAYEDYFSYGIEASEYAEEVIENSKIIDEGAVLVFYRTDDPAADFDRYDAEQQKQLEKRPKCSMCDEPIQNDFLYEINDEVICENCLEQNFRKNVEDYIE